MELLPAWKFWGRITHIFYTREARIYTREAKHLLTHVTQEKYNKPGAGNSEKTYPVMRKWAVKQRHLQNFAPASGVCCLCCVKSSSELVPLSDMLFQKLVHSSGYQIPYKSKNVWVEVRLKRIKRSTLIFSWQRQYIISRQGQGNSGSDRQKRNYLSIKHILSQLVI